MSKMSTVVFPRESQQSAVTDKTAYPVNSVICGDALTTLQSFPSGIVDAVVTSPPYFGQRDYSHAEQIGNEETPDLYIERLTAVFRECQRVLNPQGTLWVNLGDKYHNGQLMGMPWR